MEKYKSNRVPEYAGYGGVPEYEAYGRLNGGIPVEEYYSRYRNNNEEDEQEQEQPLSLHEQIQRHWEDIKAKYAAEESGIFDSLQASPSEEEEDEEELDQVQYAENGFSNVATDASFGGRNYISDDDLYGRMWNNIKDNEGVVSHPYLDTRGYITIGGGANVNNWADFRNLEATVNDIPATEEQKWKAYNRMRQLSEEEDEKGNYVNRSKQAYKFEPYTDIRISDEYARSLAQKHMSDDLAHLRHEFADFDEFPLPLKEVLLDIQYNVRGGVNERDWPNLYKAIREKNVLGDNGIAENVNRKDVSQKRNDWARQTAESIVF